MDQFRGYYPSSPASSSWNIPSSSRRERDGFQSFAALYDGDNGASSSTEMTYGAAQTTARPWIQEMDSWLLEPAELPPSNTPFAYFDPPAVHTASLPPPLHDYPALPGLPSTSYIPVDVAAIERDILNLPGGPEPQPQPFNPGTPPRSQSPLLSELDVLLKEIEENQAAWDSSLQASHYEESGAFIADKYAGQGLITNDEYASSIQGLGGVEGRVGPTLDETHGEFSGYDTSGYGHSTTFPFVAAFEIVTLPSSSSRRGSNSLLAERLSPLPQRYKAAQSLAHEVTYYTSPPPLPCDEAAGLACELPHIRAPTSDTTVAEIPAATARKRKAPADDDTTNAERDVKKTKTSHEDLETPTEFKQETSADEIKGGDFNWDLIMSIIHPSSESITDALNVTNDKKRKATSEPDEKDDGSSENEHTSRYSPRKRQQIRQGKQKADNDMPIEVTRSVAGREDIQEPTTSSVRREGTPSSLFSAPDDNVSPFEPPSESLSCGKVQEYQLTEQNLPVASEGNGLRDPVLSSASRGKAKARRAVRPPGKISRTNTEKERYTCLVDGCEKSFTRTHDVKRHMSSVHNPVEYECVNCGAKLNGRKDSVQRHERTCRAAPGRDNHKKSPGSGRGPRMAGQKSTT